MEREIYSDFDIQFRQNKITKDVIKKKNIESIKQALNLLLRTRYYDRKWHPEIGSYIQDLLFKQNDDELLVSEKTELEKLFEENEPRITIDSIDISRTNHEKDNGILNINIKYTIKNLNVKDSFIYAINRLR